MTIDEAKKMLKAKSECLKDETSGINYDCNMRLCAGCSLNYEQGNMGEQKEALDIAIKVLEILANADKIIESIYGCVIVEGYADVIDQMREVYKEVNADEDSD